MGGPAGFFKEIWDDVGDQADGGGHARQVLREVWGEDAVALPAVVRHLVTAWVPWSADLGEGMELWDVAQAMNAALTEEWRRAVGRWVWEGLTPGSCSCPVVRPTPWCRRWCSGRGGATACAFPASTLTFDCVGGRCAWLQWRFASSCQDGTCGLLASGFCLRLCLWTVALSVAAKPTRGAAGCSAAPGFLTCGFALFCFSV